ncbi:unknown [Firmicutes bacterium CAG:94]|nr:unknown [Firmicutes bacterium CAG:94]
MPAFSSSSLLSSYRAVKPSKATLKPEALKIYFPAPMVAWVVFITQLAIWQAMNRSQMSL